MSTGVVRSSFRSVVRDAPFYLVVQGSQGLAGLVALSLYARALGPDDFGLYGLTITTILVTDAVFFGWAYQGALRYTADFEASRQSAPFWSTMMITASLVLLGVGVVWFGATVIVDASAHRLAQLLRVGFLTLTARIAFGLVVSALRATRQTPRYAVYSFVQSFGSLCLAAALLVTLRRHPDTILYSLALVTAILSAIEYRRLRRTWELHVRRFSPRLLKRAVTYGLPLVGASLGSLLLALADRYMLQLFRGPSEVGMYVAGYEIGDKILKTFFSVLTATSFPVLVQTNLGLGDGQSTALIRKTMHVYLLLIFPCALGLIGLGDDLTLLVLGTDFASASIVVPWVAAGTFLWGFSQVVAQFFQLQEKTSVLFYLLVPAAVINILLNIFLIPTYGIEGAALATFLAYGIYLTACFIAARESLHLLISIRTTLKAVVAGCVMLTVLVGVGALATSSVLTVLIGVVGGATVYTAVLLLLREEELRMALKVVQTLLRSRTKGT